MSRRIDIELTSARPDGSWTWRAAGAKNPKGVVDGSILPDGAGVGDELKVEIEQMLDGIEVLSIVKEREKSDRDLLELIASDKPFEAVIETRAKRGRNERRGGRDGGREGGRDNRRRNRDGERGRGRDGDGDGRRDGGGGRRAGGDRDGGRQPRRGDGDGGRQPRRGDGDGDRQPRRGDGDGQRRERRQRPHFEPPPELPQRPKPKRLRPGKARRNEVLSAVPEEQRPIAELALQGMSAVRSRVKEENTKLAKDGKPTMPEATVLKMAEEMLPKLRVADWLDRAEAAQRQMQNLDLRDLRSVVASSDDPMVARDESTRALAQELKDSLVTKQQEELTLWFADIEAAIDVGRIIRALRLSSQPPKAGVMFPPALARKLGEAATASLLPEDSGDRWSAVLEAAAFSPVRTLVVPTTPPQQIGDDLKKTALRLGPLMPQVAALLGVEVPADAPRPKPLRPGRRDNKKGSRAERPERNERSASRPRKPVDRPKGMRDVSTMPKPGDDATATSAGEDTSAEPKEVQHAEPNEAAPAEDETAAVTDSSESKSTDSSESKSTDSSESKSTDASESGGAPEEADPTAAEAADSTAADTDDS